MGKWGVALGAVGNQKLQTTQPLPRTMSTSSTTAPASQRAPLLSFFDTIMSNILFVRAMSNAFDFPGVSPPQTGVVILFPDDFEQQVARIQRLASLRPLRLMDLSELLTRTKMRKVGMSDLTAMLRGRATERLLQLDYPAEHLCFFVASYEKRGVVEAHVGPLFCVVHELNEPEARIIERFITTNPRAQVWLPSLPQMHLTDVYIPPPPDAPRVEVFHPAVVRPLVVPDSPLVTAIRQICSRRCRVCDTPAKLFCTTCKAARYCSKEHQKQDWKEKDRKSVV